MFVIFKRTDLLLLQFNEYIFDTLLTLKIFHCPIHLIICFFLHTLYYDFSIIVIWILVWSKLY